jgi:hypothetical protein
VYNYWLLFQTLPDHHLQTVVDHIRPYFKLDTEETLKEPNNNNTENSNNTETSSHHGEEGGIGEAT